MKKRIVVMGFMGAMPISGVVWQHLHYLEGLRRLGHEVYYIEDSARITYNPETFEVGEDDRHAASVLDRLSRRFNFEGRWAFRARFLPEHPVSGLSSQKISELYREADAVLNVCGAQELHEDLDRCDQLIYIESDPGVEQIKIDAGDEATVDFLRRHRVLFTFGENIGTEKFPAPLHGFAWHPTRQPVVSEWWQTPRSLPSDARFTSIANWSTSGKKDIEWRGETYLWSKSLEFLRFIETPLRAGEPFELATDIKDADIRRQFERHNWRLREPHDLSSDFNHYRRYIQDSKGEFTAAKDQYVRLRTGWFSDRSACYLAAGRPVVTQETGFSEHYDGDGLFSFNTVQEAEEAVREINRDYQKHSIGAQNLAREYFEAEKVLANLLQSAGV